jgi:hypothetical protein
VNEFIEDIESIHGSGILRASMDFSRSITILCPLKRARNENFGFDSDEGRPGGWRKEAGGFWTPCAIASNLACMRWNNSFGPRLYEPQHVPTSDRSPSTRARPACRAEAPGKGESGLIHKCRLVRHEKRVRVLSPG